MCDYSSEKIQYFFTIGMLDFLETGMGGLFHILKFLKILVCQQKVDSAQIVMALTVFHGPGSLYIPGEFYTSCFWEYYFICCLI